MTLTRQKREASLSRRVLLSLSLCLAAASSLIPVGGGAPSTFVSCSGSAPSLSFSSLRLLLRAPFVPVIPVIAASRLRHPLLRLPLCELPLAPFVPNRGLPLLQASSRSRLIPSSPSSPSSQRSVGSKSPTPASSLSFSCSGSLSPAFPPPLSLFSSLCRWLLQAPTVPSLSLSSPPATLSALSLSPPAASAAVSSRSSLIPIAA